MATQVKLCRVIVKLESNEENSKKVSSDDESVFGDALEAGDTIDITSPLPCEDPSLNPWGGVVYGRDVDHDGSARSASTAVNRIEFPDTSSTLRKGKEAINRSTMTWDQNTYKGYKLNCIKKKGKVESMIELFNEDSITSVQDKEIFKSELKDISSVALGAIEYINDVAHNSRLMKKRIESRRLRALKKPC